MLISTILSVILLLGIVGYIIYSSKSKQIYPVSINDCPDYYSMNANNKCVADAAVWTIPSSNTNKCNNIDFVNGSYNDISYNSPGKTANSGACAKKSVSNFCGITWDGITNDNSIC